MTTQSNLLRQRRFLPLFITQFLGALNDNALKNALVVLLTFQATNWTTLRPEVLANLATGTFILPFFLFSATAGQLADKFDKARLARLVKTLEIGIVLVAGAGFAMHSLEVLMAALFLLGLHSTLFGPIKYAILPQHLRQHELIGGNALIEAGTFVAILLGTLLGGLLAGSAGGTGAITFAGLTISVTGYLASRGIPHAPPPAPQLKISLNPISETWRSVNFARENRTVFLSILGISWFWLYGATLLAQFPAYTRNILGGSETAVTLLLATFTLGIGVGSLLCERLSSGRVELGLVPFGSIGLTLFGLDLAIASPDAPASAVPLGAIALLALPGTWRVLADLALLGVFGGFFIVPLYALVQQRSSEEHRARTIAANNIFNAMFMVFGALAAAGMLSSGLTIPALFGVAALCNAAVAIFIYRLIPEFLLRFVVWILVHSVYRLRTDGLHRIPERGPAIIVCNRVSFVDALIITAACPRPIRFVMDHRVFRWPMLNILFRESRAIPLAPPGDDAALTKQSFDDIATALAAGDLIGIFTGQQITGNGEGGKVCSDIGAIVGRHPVPVVPMVLRGQWGAVSSRVELVVGDPIAAADATPELLREKLAMLPDPTP